MKPPAAIGLTGGIACGKSEVAAILAINGVPVLDADAVARGLLNPGEEVFDRVVHRFGSAIMAPDGTINRTALGRIVFRDGGARADLNALMHPEVYRRIDQWMREHLARHPRAVAMIPLLYETGDPSRFDRILVVAADEALMIHRMMQRGWTRAESEARLAAQMPLAEKVKRADAVIWNNDDLAALKTRTMEVWKKLIRGKENEA